MMFSFIGCQSIHEPGCGLFYGDSLELYLGQKVYSCDSAWFCIDSIIQDTRSADDPSGVLEFAMSYEIDGSLYHEHFNTADSWVVQNNFTGYQFLLQEVSRNGFVVTSYYLNVYDIYPDQAINLALYDNRFRLYGIYDRDIEG
jgi:hypothetical protein